MPRLPTYRESYANSVQVRVSVWDFQLVFGLASSESPEQVTIRNHQAIFLSPQQAKALWNVLGQNLAQYEQAFGTLNLEPQGQNLPARAGQLELWANDWRHGSIPRRSISLPLESTLLRSRGSDAPLPLWMIFPVVFAALYASHFALLRLPYYWDEAGLLHPRGLGFLPHRLAHPHHHAQQRPSAAAQHLSRRSGGRSAGFYP